MYYGKNICVVISTMFSDNMLSNYMNYAKLLADKPQEWSTISSIERLAISKFIVDFEFDEIATSIIESMPQTNGGVKSITFVVTSLTSGGAERNGVNVANLLSLSGYDVQIIYSRKTAKSYKINASVATLFVASDDTERYQKIYKYCKEHKTDTVVLLNHWQLRNFKDIFWFKLMGFRVIAQEHSNFYYPLYNGFDLSLMSKRLKAYRIVDYLTCLSAMDVYLWKQSGVQKVCYLPNLTSSQIDCPTFNSRDPAVLVLSRMTIIKGLDRLPTIIQKVLNHHPEVKFYLVGGFTSKYRKILFKFRLWLKLNKRYNSVIFSDFTDNPELFLKKTRCLLIPSYIEGSPMVISEARSQGTPIVLYGMDYIDNAKSGCIHIQRGNVNALVDSISQLVLNEKKWAENSRACIRGIDFWFSDSVKEQWEKLFSVLSRTEMHVLDKDSKFLSQDSTNAMNEFYSMLEYFNEHKLILLARLLINCLKK